MTLQELQAMGAKPVSANQATTGGFSLSQIKAMGGKSIAELQNKTGDVNTPVSPQSSGQQPENNNQIVGPTFPSSPLDSPLEAGLKTAGNIPSSAANFVASSAVAPLKGLADATQIPGAAYGLVKEQGVVGAAGNFLQALPETLYQALIPNIAKAGLKYTAAKIGGAMGAPQQNVERMINEAGNEAQSSITNDPVGQILPFLMLGRGAATKAGLGAQFDSAVSTMAKPATLAAETVAKGVNTTGKIATSMATGLKPDTVSQVVNNPTDFSKANMNSFDRASLGNEILTSLDKKSDTISETGQAYAPIRGSEIPVKVSPNFLGDMIKETTGLKVSNLGELESSAASKIRDAKDVSALQNLYNTYSPEFAKGTVTPNEFLNFRTDLAKLSKYGREITSSQDLEAVSRNMRSITNDTYRPQINGLKELDNAFAPIKNEFDTLKKGLLDKNGNLSDSAVTKIANATGKGKDQVLSRLEQITPGITTKIKLVKAIEDIQGAGQGKIGNALHGGAALFGLSTANPSIIISALLTHPTIAVPLLRGFGASAATIGKITGLINDLPNSMNKAIGGTIDRTSRQSNPQVQLQTPQIGASRINKATLKPSINNTINKK